MSDRIISGRPADAVTFLGHPRGVFVLFSTELWERFSFNGLLALLFLYLTKHFILTDRTAYEVLGAYVALAFMAPVLGGYIADRYLGYRRAIILGGLLLIAGHFGMAFEGTAATRLNQNGETSFLRDELALQVLYLSLGLVITGVGFLKSSMSALVGELYKAGDKRRDSGFTIFYMGINTGAFFGPLICGYLGETYGWRYGFGLAGIGMALGLVQFIRGEKYFGDGGMPPDRQKLGAKILPFLTVEGAIYLFALAMVVASWALLQAYSVVGYGLALTGATVGLFILWYSLKRCTPAQRLNHLAAVALMLLAVVFWSMFVQAGTSLTAFTDRLVDRNVFGIEVKTSQFQSLNAIFIVLLAPLFSMLWIALSRTRFSPSTPIKFALGILQGGLAFLVLVVGTSLAEPGGQVAVIWLVIAYFLLTTGELCISPVGMSAMSKLSAPAIAGTMMGTWFLTISTAGYIGSLIARLTSIETIDGTVAELENMPAVYAGVFTQLFWVGLIAAIGALILSPVIARAMRGAE